MTGTELTGRPNQRTRTRKDLLRAASRLMNQGRQPSLEDVAQEALVSRATAYRYFSSVEALLVEASFDVGVPEPEDLFGGDASQDPVARLQRVDTALHDMILTNETPLRMMLVQTLQRGIRGETDEDIPQRQNRRTPLIEAALEPAGQQFTPATMDTLCKALALIIGTEAMVVLKDVLQLDDADAREVKQWAINALVEAARKSSDRN
jgi:AcrR family transcriptional regulator